MKAEKKSKSSSQAVRVNVCEKQGHRIIFDNFTNSNFCGACGMKLEEIRGGK